jgi:hypothetical protein
MDIEDPRFEAYEKRFRELADQAELVKVAQPSLNRAQYYLCLYGENGLTPEEEFEFLDKMGLEAGKNLKRIEVESDIWQDIVLFVP